MPAWMPVSRAMDGNFLESGASLEVPDVGEISHPCDWIPAIPAGMTDLNNLNCPGLNGLP